MSCVTNSSGSGFTADLPGQDKPGTTGASRPSKAEWPPLNTRIVEDINNTIIADNPSRKTEDMKKIALRLARL